ncbi:MAG: 2-iminobutanoate/2-iminopropanoate deaminase [Gammaproteobacteria bacterium]
MLILVFVFQKECPVKRIQPSAVPASNAPFSQLVMDDQYAFLAGLVAADFAEGIAVLGDVAKETEAVMTAIRSMLEEVGLSMSQLVQVSVHLSDLDDFDAMDAVYRSFFADSEFPARTTTESRRLFGDSKVEITCQARLNAGSD